MEAREGAESTKQRGHPASAQKPSLRHVTALCTFFCTAGLAPVLSLPITMGTRRDSTCGGRGWWSEW